MAQCEKFKLFELCLEEYLMDFGWICNQHTDVQKELYYPLSLDPYSPFFIILYLPILLPFILPILLGLPFPLLPLPYGR